MIHVTRLTGAAFTLNPDLIEKIEATPDTVIHIVGGNDYVVKESAEEIVNRIRRSRAEVLALSNLIEYPRNDDGAPTLRVVPNDESEA